MAKPSIKMLLNMVMMVELRLFCIEVNFCRGGMGVAVNTCGSP